MSTIRELAAKKAAALEAAGKSVLGFFAVNLKRFHKGNGDVVKPNEEGLFVPKDEEEADILAWHLEQGRVSLEDPKVVAEEQE